MLTAMISLLLSTFLSLCNASSDTNISETLSQLKGWHSRALDRESPSPYVFNWTGITKDDFDLFVGCSSMVDPEGFVVAFFQHPITSAKVVVDSQGRILLPQPEDYDTMIQTSRAMVGKEFFDGEWERDYDEDDEDDDDLYGRTKWIPDIEKKKIRKTYQSWTIDWGWTCQPGDNFQVRLPSGWKGHSVTGFSPKTSMRRLDRKVKEWTEIPEVLYDWMLTVYEAGMEWTDPSAQEGKPDAIRKVKRAFRPW